MPLTYQPRTQLHYCLTALSGGLVAWITPSVDSRWTKIFKQNRQLKKGTTIQHKQRLEMTRLKYQEKKQL